MSDSDCQNKLAYETQAEAEGAKVTAQNTYSLEAKLVTYKCKHCSMWHLASKH